jgi:hypothetical protein
MASQNLTAAQQDKLEKGALDLFLQGNSGVFMTVTNNPKRFKGQSVKKAIIVEKNTQGGTFSGMATFDGAIPQTKTNIIFYPGRMYKPIVIDQSEIDVNSIDPEAAYDLKRISIEEATNSLADDFGTAFYGLNSDSKGFNGLRYIVDDGTEQATYGGLTRSALTNNNLDSFYDPVGGALASGNMARIETAITKATIANKAPNLVITDKTTWATYVGLLSKTNNVNSFDVGSQVVDRFGTIQNRSSQGLSVGFTAVNLFGIPFIYDDKCPSTFVFVLNTNELTWYGLPSQEEGAKTISFGGNSEVEGVYKGMKSENVGLTMRGLWTAPNLYGSVGQLILQGQLVSFDPRKHAKLKFA